MFSIMNIINKITGNKIPPIMRGTKAIISQMAEEERKIAELSKIKSDKVHSMIRQKEDMSDIFTKYVNKDFNKDIYLFIK